jgi:oligopeptide transport system ATP-binding protein
MALMQLLPDTATMTSGTIAFAGQFGSQDLGTLSERDMQKVRGREIAMVFQDPMASLNPILTVGHQTMEPLRLQMGLAKRAARARAEELLALVRIPSPTQIMRAYPHELSGGMRQRVMIAIALSCGPKLLIADEPTTALDVTTQAQILELLRDLNEQTGAAIILITHNLGVVAGLCKRVLVMYAGEIVEEGTAEQIFERPQHPYTWSLLRSVPRIDANRGHRLLSIEGLPPDLIDLPQGCKFNPRCPFRVERCFTESPPIEQVAPAQHAACWVTMERAYAEMGAGTITDTSPGAASGVHPAGRPRPVADVPAAVAEAGQ